MKKITQAVYDQLTLHSFFIPEDVEDIQQRIIDIVAKDGHNLELLYAIKLSEALTKKRMTLKPYKKRGTK